MTSADTQFMRRAIAISQQAREHGNHPFGAILVDANQRVLLEAENTVVTERDQTGHAETNLVRLATRSIAPEILTSCTLYSSAEPCAMCAGAIHWANIGRLVFGVSGPTFYAMVGAAPDLLKISCREILGHAVQPIEVIGPLLEDEALAEHQGFWQYYG